jgi:uncharacterized protein (TIGR02246 family)
MRADAQTQAAIECVLDRFADAYAKRNVDDILTLFAPEADVALIGTGADERRLGHSEIRRQVERNLDQAETVHWNWMWDTVSRTGPVAWVTADAMIRVIDGQDINMPVRLTAVMEEVDGSWRIAQMHISMAALNQEEGQSFPCD